MITTPASDRTTAVLNAADTAAAHHGGTPWPLIAAVIAAAALIYALACLITPFGRCRRCHGTGRYRRPAGRVSRPCSRCKGTGKRLRWGRHVSNYLHTTRDHSRRADTQRTRLNRGPR